MQIVYESLEFHLVPEMRENILPLSINAIIPFLLSSNLMT